MRDIDGNEQIKGPIEYPSNHWLRLWEALQQILIRKGISEIDLDHISNLSACNFFLGDNIDQLPEFKAYIQHITQPNNPHRFTAESADFLARNLIAALEGGVYNRELVTDLRRSLAEISNSAPSQFDTLFEAMESSRRNDRVRAEMNYQFCASWEKYVKDYNACVDKRLEEEDALFQMARTEIRDLCLRRGSGSQDDWQSMMRFE